MLGARDEAAEFDEMDASTPAEMFNDDPRFDIYVFEWSHFKISSTDAKVRTVVSLDCRMDGMGYLLLTLTNQLTFFFRVVVNRQANKLWFLVKVVPEKTLGDVKVCKFLGRLQAVLFFSKNIIK